MAGGSKGKIVEFTMGKQLRKNYSLLPIVFIGVFGMGLSAFAIIRTLARSPDVSINRRGNPRPYEKYLTEENKPVQYKYFTTLDYNKMNIERPKID